MPDALPMSVFPAAEPITSIGDLWAALRRIDGWGPRAWRETHGRYRAGRILLAIEGPLGGDAEREVVVQVALAAAAGPALPVADWALRQAWASGGPCTDGSGLICLRPGPTVRATTAARTEDGRLVMTFSQRLPYAGMCCDARAFGRGIRQLLAWAARVGRTSAGRRAHVRAWQAQQALRADLGRQGLSAFLADGSRLVPEATPLQAPASWRVTLNGGPLGPVTGLGIPVGVTAIAGAPYHGKSTFLAALAAGADDHPPGDGRELVVSPIDTVSVQAEEGRRIKAQDLSNLFARLPGGDARAFSTARASGATSMAATALQAVAAGARLLLIDEDTAAGNALAIDAPMRRFLGKDLVGTTTLLECLPSLVEAGVSCVLVAGSTARSLAAADQVLLLRQYRPLDATRRARAVAARLRPTPMAMPRRVLCDDPEVLLHGHHFVDAVVSDPLRPLLRGEPLDLRRSGLALDPAQARGALAAAAWCVRLANGAPIDMNALGRCYCAFLAERGAAGLDPYHHDDLVVAPWPVVAAVLERLAKPAISSG